MAKMRALVTGGQGKVSVQEVDVPTPVEGEILVKVDYVAQNPTDWKAAAMVPAGRIVGCDFAGTVADPNGSSWREGQRVAGFVQGSSENGIGEKPLRGVFAEYCVIESSLVYSIPDSVRGQDAAAIPLAFATAVQALFQRLGLPEPSKPAKSTFPLLISGGTSSVGKYAIQLGKLAGLFVVATGSKRNHELLKSLGADAVVDYNDRDWAAEVRKITHDGLEHALDCIGAGGTYEACAEALSPTKGGHIVGIIPPGPSRDKIKETHSKVKIETTCVYTVFERPIQFKIFDNCGESTPQDKAFWEKYVGLLPELLSSGKLKANNVREAGGLEDIEKGFQEHKEGKVSAEKLVYKIGQ